jgi:hypothetical protein
MKSSLHRLTGSGAVLTAVLGTVVLLDNALTPPTAPVRAARKGPPQKKQ